MGVWSVASPSPLPSPLGRGRTVRGAFANPGRLDWLQRGTRCSLSLRERARMRGNQTLPTKTAGQILQAQLDRLPEPPHAGLEFLLVLVSTKIALLTELGAVS